MVQLGGSMQQMQRQMQMTPWTSQSGLSHLSGYSAALPGGTSHIGSNRPHSHRAGYSCQAPLLHPRPCLPEGHPPRPPLACFGRPPAHPAENPGCADACLCYQWPYQSLRPWLHLHLHNRRESWWLGSVNAVLTLTYVPSGFTSGPAVSAFSHSPRMQTRTGVHVHPSKHAHMKRT